MVHFARENFAKKYAKNIPRKNLGMKIWIKGTDWVEVLLACHVQTSRFKGGRAKERWAGETAQNSQNS